MPNAAATGPSVALIVPLALLGAVAVIVSLVCLLRWVRARKGAKRSDGAMLPFSDALTGPV
jgi:hypothetical protein